MVEPATVDEASVHAIQANDVVRTKESVENESDHSTDCVLGEDIEGVVDANQEFDLGSEVTADTGDHAEDDGCPWRKETGSRSSGHESRDGTGAPADERPLLGQAEIEEAPGHGGKHGSQT